MHLMRLGGAGEEKPVVRADDGTLYDISGLTGDIDGAFLAGGGITPLTVPACVSARRSRCRPRSCASA
jgi:hypothetical protein